MSTPAIETKRTRDANWSEAEKNLLLDLLQEHVKIVEDKNTDTNINKKKNSAWKEIAEKFNMKGENNRPAVKIWEQWRRMKTGAKKNIRAYERSLNSTGGSQKKVNVNAIDWRIKSLAPRHFLSDGDPYDCNRRGQFEQNDDKMKKLLDRYSPVLRHTDRINMQCDYELIEIEEVSREDDGEEVINGEVETSDNLSTIICNQQTQQAQSDVEVPAEPALCISQTPISEKPPLNRERAARAYRRPQHSTMMQRHRKFNMNKYHKMLIQKKKEDFQQLFQNRAEIHALELKNRKEIQALEVRKRQLDIDINELYKKKLEAEIKNLL